MPGNRMSALPLAVYCGRSGGLDTGAGRAAAMSTAFHSRCAGDPKAVDLFARLSADEQETVKGWLKPEDVYAGKVLLRYSEAERELEVAVDKYGEAVSPDSPDCESVGHLDMAWAVDGVAYVADIKKTEFTATDGVESLQLVAYGFAFASLRGCDSFCLGIWAAEEGRWTWGESIRLDSQKALDLWTRALAAMRNVGGEFSRGSHCRGCYSRFQCPAHLIPPEHAETSLAPLTAGTAITQENALHLLLLCNRVEDTLKKAKDALKDYATREGGIADGQGKVWRPVLTSGRESLDQKALFEAMPEAKAFMKRGNPFTTMKWCKQ